MKKRMTLLLALICCAAVLGFSPAETAQAASGLTGTALNLLFFIEIGGSGEEGYFAGQSPGQTVTRREQTLSLFNEEALGVKSYFSEISGSAFTLHTVEVPGVFVDGHTHQYYLPYAKDNPEGYWSYLDGELKVYECGCTGTCGEKCDDDPSDGIICLCAAEDPVDSMEKLRREQLLVRTALTELLASPEGQALAEALGSGAVDLDGDGSADLGPGALDLNRDGEADLITFYVSGGGLTPSNTSANTAAFWPHKWELPDVAALRANYLAEFSALDAAQQQIFSQRPSVEGCDVRNYVLLADEYVRGSFGGFESGVLCHETIHMLDDLTPGGSGRFGVTDLYHYAPVPGEAEPVGVWDIMGVTTNSPQSLNAWYRSKFGWTEIEWASAGQTRYTLYPRGQGTSALRFGDHEGQFFVIETKTRTADGLDRELPYLREGETGLLCYRVDPGAAGESGGNIDGRDEIYVLRHKGVLSSSHLFDGVFTEGESFGSVEAAETENVFGYLTGEGLLNSRAVLRNITLNDDGSVSFDLYLSPDFFEVSGSFVFADFPAEGVQIFRNGVYAATALEADFTIEVQDGDLLTFFARGWELPSVTVTEGMISLGLLTALPKATVRMEIALTDADGLPFTEETPVLLLNGQPFEDFTFREGVIGLELYDTDVITVQLENYTPEDLGEGPGVIRVQAGRAGLKVYGYCAVSGQVLDEEGLPVEGMSVLIKGLEVAVTDAEGRFSVERVAYGSTISFRGRSHRAEDCVITESADDLAITAVRNPGAIRAPAWTIFAMLLLFVGSVYYYLVVDTRKKYGGSRRKR